MPLASWQQEAPITSEPEGASRGSYEIQQDPLLLGGGCPGPIGKEPGD